MPLPAPVRPSITSCWPSVSLMWLPTRRAVMSAAEPGGKPIINRSGCDGNSPARASGAAATAVSARVSVRISAHTARRCMARPPLALFLSRVARFGDFNGIILCRRAVRGDVAYWHMPSAPMRGRRNAAAPVGVEPGTRGRSVRSDRPREERSMLKLGYKLMSEEHGPVALVRNAQRAEQAGFDFAAISDHFFPWLEEQGHAPFAWSVLGALANATRR